MLSRPTDRRERRKTQQESVRNKKRSAGERTSGGEGRAKKDRSGGTSIPLLSEEDREKAMAFIENDLKANEKTYEALARE